MWINKKKHLRKQTKQFPNWTAKKAQNSFHMQYKAWKREMKLRAVEWVRIDRWNRKEREGDSWIWNYLEGSRTRKRRERQRESKKKREKGEECFTITQNGKKGFYIGGRDKNGGTRFICAFWIKYHLHPAMHLTR